MERTTTLKRAKEIMTNNFIGPNELKLIEKEMGIYIPEEVLIDPPIIQFDEELLEKLKNEYILILGIPYYKDKTPLTIVKMREHFGWDPDKSEPCFYNQDWYLSENFAKKLTLDLKWNLIGKNLIKESRGINPDYSGNTKEFDVLPSALLLSFTFFAYFLHTHGKILWESEYVWCKDLDHQGDRIYIGKYIDRTGINKNGFNIHRHLKINNNYGIINSK